MIIDTAGNGSFLFQSLDLTDQKMYYYSQTGNNSFVPVANIAIGNGMGNIVLSQNTYILTSNSIQTPYMFPQCGRFMLANSMGLPDLLTLQYNGGGVGHGSSNTIGFFPFGGNTIKINGIIYNFNTILANGFSCYVNGQPGQSVVNVGGAYGLYYVYVFNSGANGLQLDFSLANVTGRATSTTPGNVGVEIKAGDDTRTLVGMVLTNNSASANCFWENNSSQWTATWFNRYPRPYQEGSISESATSTGGAWSAEIALDLIGWADSLWHPAFYGQADPQSVSAEPDAGIGWTSGFWNNQTEVPNLTSDSTIGPGPAAEAWYPRGTSYPTSFGVIGTQVNTTYQGIGGQGDAAIGLFWSTIVQASTYWNDVLISCRIA